MFLQFREHRHLVDADFAEAARDRAIADVGVSERDSEGALHGRIGEVALETRYRELSGIEFKEGVREPQVAFRILEIYRIDLVRHRGGADFSLFRLLRKPAVAYIPPHILRKIYEDSVDPAKVVEKLRKRVVRLDLGRAGIKS